LQHTSINHFDQSSKAKAMAGADTNLAAAALAIALVALFTALGQLLQQYLATADGYRRCQKSVMGEYAKKTRLRWRWSEFRFETLYATPQIFLTGDGAPVKLGQVLLTGSDTSREKSLIPADSINTGAGEIPDFRDYGTAYSQHKEAKKHQTKKLYRDQGEMACWLPFLHWAHETAEACLNAEQKSHDPITFPPPKIRLPAVVFCNRSWDFQPLDVVRPLAKTTVSDIAILARRMGMRWKDFRPSDGIMRAEGHSHIINSTVVRSLGIVLQYSYSGQGRRLNMADKNLGRAITFTGSVNKEQEEIYIPRAGADRLGSGVIRGAASTLGIPDFTISTQAEIVTALSQLDRSGTSSAALKAILKENPDFKLRVGDLVALSTSMIRYRGSNLVQIPAPSDNVAGISTTPIGRRAFRECLEEYITKQHSLVGESTHAALQVCHDIGAKFAAWDHTDPYSVDTERWVVTRDERYLDTLQGHFWSLTTLLQEWDQDSSAFRYINLLGSHIRIAIFCDGGETGMLRSFGTDYRKDVEGYFEVLPRIVEDMRKTGFYDQKLIVDAWVTMMLRALCWGACHFFVPGERVPTAYYGSQLPVYIG
jgi:hypothetical protein